MSDILPDVMTNCLTMCSVGFQLVRCCLLHRLVVVRQLSNILPEPLINLTSDGCLSDVLPDLLANLTTDCWLSDVFPEIVTNLTGGWWQMFGDRWRLLRAEL